MFYLPPLALYTLGWLIGIGLAPGVPQPWWAWLLLSALAAAGAWLARRDQTIRNLAIAAVLLGLGAARWVVAQPTYDDSFIATYNDTGEAALEGVVIGEPDVRDTYVNLRLAADTLLLADAAAPLAVRGLVLVQAPRYPAIQYGDRVRAYGDLQTPPTFEDFSYADYLARQGVYSILRRANANVIEQGEDKPRPYEWQIAIFKPIYALKAHALAAIAATFPEPQGSLLSGILLGVESGIPDSLKNAFRVTGTSHIVAISGFNISIIAGVFTKLFRRIFGEKRAVPLVIIAIALYTVLAGASASVVRAAIMGTIVLIAGGLNRPSTGLASLAAAAFLMTAVSPGTLWDVGFQLSAAATLGLVLYAEPFTRATTRALARFTSQENADRLIAVGGEFSILTLAAQITTLPLIAFYFHQISLVSLAANLIVLPVQPQVMILGGITAIGAMIHSTVGALLAWLAWPFVTFTIVVVELLAKVPGAAISIGRFPVIALFAMYTVIFGLTWVAGREPDQRPGWWRKFAAGWLPNIALAALAFGALAAWNVVLNRPDGNLRVTFFDVGDGDSILIQTPSGRYALIDGGPSPNALAESLGRALPLTTRRIDLVIAASPATKSAGGLPGLFDRYTMGRVVTAGEAARTSAYREWMEGLASRSISTLSAEAGQRFDLGNGAVLTTVAVSEKGATLRLDYGSASFLFPVGLEAKGATELAVSGEIAPAMILLAPDGGGENSISALFVDAANPRGVVIAVGAGNPAGHPREETLALFEGRAILRTDERGAITFATDGEQLWAKGER